MNARVEKCGDGLAVVIPPEIAAQTGLTAGAEVVVAIENGTIVIYPPGVKRYTLEELVAGITPENVHGETDWGPPVGREVW